MLKIQKGYGMENNYEIKGPILLSFQKNISSY